MRRSLLWSAAAGWAILLTATVISAAGCSLATAYQKEKGTPSSDTVTRMGEAAWRIDLSGYVTNSRQEVLATLIRRCAEVTSQAGYDYFIVTGGEVYGENDPQPAPLATYAPEGSPAGTRRERCGSASATTVRPCSRPSRGRNRKTTPLHSTPGSSFLDGKIRTTGAHTLSSAS